MPISGQTVEKLRKLTALTCCPSCGKRTEQIESLTSCGHFLCVNCVNKFVLNSDNKCPKCYAINRRNDCREDVFVGNIFKIGHRIDKLLDKQSSEQSESKEELADKPKDAPKKEKSEKQLVIESLNSCVTKESKSKPKNTSSMADTKSKTTSASTSSVADNKSKVSPIKKKTENAINKKSFDELDDDIVSIPDSFDNTLFTQSSRNGDTEIVSMILEGLESNMDPEILDITEKNGSRDQSKFFDDSNTVANDKKVCLSKPKMKDIGVQTFDTKVVLHNVSVQCRVQQETQAIQTDTPHKSSNTTTAVNESSDDCQSDDCCFHKFVESVSCNSLKHFLKSLMEMKDRPQDVQQIPKTPQPSEPVVTNSNKQPTNEIISGAPKVETQSKIEEPMASFDLFNTNSSVDSIPSSLPEEINESPKKTITKKHVSEDKKKTKKSPSVQPINKSKKITPKESSDEEMEETIKESKVKEPVVPKGGVQIDLSDVTQQSNIVVEESTSKPKPRIRGPKSRQNITASKNKISEEKDAKKPKKQRTYVSSDDEEEEEVVKTVLEKKTITKQNIKSRANPKKTQNIEIKTLEESVISMDATTDDTTFNEKHDPIVSKNPKKRTASVSGLTKKSSKKSNVDKTAEVLVEKSKTKNVFNFSEDENKEENESKDSNQRNKRKAVPKKRFPIDDDNEKEESVEKISKKRQTIDNKTDDSIVNDLKSSTYKPRPKSKQKANPPPLKEPNEVFKRPLPQSPSHSTSDESISSSSSRQRNSSTERSNQKRVILFSGLDEKQKKKIENVCRELDAEAVSDWSDRVTHLVIALADDRPKKDLICPRNAKYIKALLNNLWIVSYDWIVDSSRSDRFVDESNYEIKGDKTATERGLPNVSRSSRQKLFEKRMVKFEGKFGAILEDFKAFVEIGGGIVIQSEDEFDKKKSKTGTNKLIVVTEAVGLPNTQKDGTKYISKKAFMDNISNFIPI